MEFLSEYGMFLAKTITFVIAFGVIVGIAVAAGAKQQNKESGHIEVKNINEKYKKIAEGIEQEVLSDKARKAKIKSLKKEEKEKEKERKKLEKSNSGESANPEKKRVFVTSFDGDIKASDTDNLRETITSILSVANQHDEVVVLLESQGGMVHSYGLASSQLARVTAKDIPLTICVDKVAASGGYMMACVANKILAAPFAIIGSIGVVAQLPNFHKLLKKNDIDYEMLTAGEYKRTLTMFGENTEKGREKFVKDLEDTHVLFKDFITQNRSNVDIDKVATGEIWFGTRALDQQLIDEVKTSDEYLYDLYLDEVDVYEVNFVQKKNLAEKFGLAVHHAIDKTFFSLLQKINNKIYS